MHGAGRTDPGTAAARSPLDRARPCAVRQGPAGRAAGMSAAAQHAPRGTLQRMLRLGLAASCLLAVVTGALAVRASDTAASAASADTAARGCLPTGNGYL